MQQALYQLSYRYVIWKCAERGIEPLGDGGRHYPM